MKKRLLFLMFLILVVGIVVASIVLRENQTATVKEESPFEPKTKSSGSETQYEINLRMDDAGMLHVASTVNAQNTSDDTWEELVFYFIPNLFTERSSEQLENDLDVYADVQFQQVAVNGQTADYSLDLDTLHLPLDKLVEAGEKVHVEFSYELTFPEGGFRFTKLGENFHLAQFYPMLATFRDGEWNKEEYQFNGETYHTGFSDVKVWYEIPEGYTFVSTGEDRGQRVGTLEVDYVKEFFIAIVKNPAIIENKTDHVKIRVFGFEEEEDVYEELGEVAADALEYFQELMGPLPFEQLDLIMEGPGMEYPGIVTVGSFYEEPLPFEELEDTVVHEIAHQYFYGVISNDPYYAAWLDEGFAEFATSLYFWSASGEELPDVDMDKELGAMPINLPLYEYDDDEEDLMTDYIYGKSSLMLWKLIEKNGGGGSRSVFKELLRPLSI